MIVQTKTATTTTAVVDTTFDLNHNPNVSRVMVFISAITSGTAKQIDGRLHPDAPWTPLEYPTAGSNTLTNVTVCSQYRIRTQTSGSTQTTTIHIGN